MNSVLLRPRARRYPIVTTLRFRQGADEAWRSAWTLDMSRTGVRFSHEGPAPHTETGIEFVLALPIFTGASGSQVRCTGRVARLEQIGLRDGSWTVAVTVDHYQFMAGMQQ
jgi:hypothetical protein